MSGERPVSARSRDAWNQDKAAADPEALYMDQLAVGTPEGPGVGYEGGEPQGGPWFSVKRSVRGLWATRMTEETKTDRELYVKTTLRELVVYVVFLVVISVLTFGMTSSNMYYYTKVMSELFLDSELPDSGATFRGMTHPNDFWRFAEGPLMDGLYWDEWYNGRNVTEHGYIFHENKLLGVPRIRQLKVRNDSCSVHEDFRSEIPACYAPYDKVVQMADNIGPMQGKTLLDRDNPPKNETAFVYFTEDELGGRSHWGLLATYAGGGYYQDLSTDKAQTEDLIRRLKDNLWLDRGTRAVFFDFTVYNANINLFCVVKLVVEFPATGGVIPSWSFRTVKLIRYVTVSDYFVLACEMIFVLFILYYGIEEIIEIKRHRLSYFKGFWNNLDIILIAISCICIAFSVYRMWAVDNILNSLLDNKTGYADFEFLGFWQTQFNNVVAIAIFVAWIKTFKYISFNKTMTQLSSTLSRCAKDIGGFFIMFSIIFVAFAQLGYLIFGTQVKDFHTFGTAVFTLLRIILGDFDFHALEQANRVLGPFFFCSYVFFVFFVLLNMFLAIINDTYSEVKEELAQQKNEFEIADYFKKGYGRMVNKLTNKRDRITDIKNALEKADANKNKQVDFTEWRSELKGRGYSDSEIEALFAKYDVDGDRVLNEEEMKRMQADLDGQALAVNDEIANAAVGDGDSGQGSFDNQSTAERAEAAGGRAVRHEELDVLARRVDRMETNISAVVAKIDDVLTRMSRRKEE